MCSLLITDGKTALFLFYTEPVMKSQEKTGKNKSAEILVVCIVPVS